MAATEWIAAIDKRPVDRSRRDADLIAHRLRRVEALDRLPSSILHQLALVGYYEDLEKGVTQKQGDHGSFREQLQDQQQEWLVCLGVPGVSGSERPSYTEATAPGTPSSPCTTPTVTSRRSASPDEPDPAKPITDAPGAQAIRIGFVLRHLLAAGFAPDSLRGALTLDGQVIFARGRRAWTGSDLVDWLIEVSGGLVRSRQQACAMWQCLLEEGVIVHGELHVCESPRAGFELVGE
ncbi:rap guanine nucleotide exchange factor 4-like [Frankliniella occidentalis]|uniref:Rap guanine nucleotide exchange factor 4-like n=1 Tax=Frankliniella occidentalis TaxID=133901 RepID=A0A9C6X2G2_FRAOC|nr:rap guanine nucleotide exchange factor 4-like [Frankliniella occidentalis]